MRIRRLTCAEWLVVGPIAMFVVMLALPALQTIHWVGSTDLEVEFVVTDGATGDPVPNAEFDILSEGGFGDEHEPRDFKLVTGTDGRVNYPCRNSMCFGTSGPFKDTYVVHLPWWRFRVVANGYEKADWVELDVPEFISQAHRAGLGKSKLVVPVAIHKSQAEPIPAPIRGGR